MASDVPGTVYLLHLDPPYQHARHYLGWAADLAARLAEHTEGRGARLLAVQQAAGGTWHLTRTWADATRGDERRIKDTAHVPHYCPDCQPGRSAARRTARHTRKETTMTDRQQTPEQQAGDRTRTFWQDQAQQAASNPGWLETLPPKTATSVRLTLADREAS